MLYLAATLGSGGAGAGGTIAYTRRQIVRRNGGSSVRDQLDRIEQSEKANGERLARIEARLDEGDRRMDRIEHDVERLEDRCHS